MKTKKIISTILAGLMVGAVMTTTPTFIFANDNNSIVSFANKEINTINGVADFQKGTASITINGNQNQTLNGKKFEVYTLFFAENSDGGKSINYTFNPVYQEALKQVIAPKLNTTADKVTEYMVIDYIQSINQNKQENANDEQPLESRYSEFRYFIEELRNKMNELNMSGDIVNVMNTRVDNSIKIQGLQYGYYIVDEITNVQDTFSSASLCIVDTANPLSEIDVKSDYPVITKKIQEDDNRNVIGNQGWNDIGDYEIGQTVPYKFESNIPNINGYHTYKYVWHDIMDKALTFNKDSVEITIKDSNKTYTLKSNEFKVITENINNETFNVVIDDIKSIVDREFNNIDNQKHNTYGQTVTLTFNATLNDNASLDTGRPGFENDVRLEFSNDPDNNSSSTGFTPWDTVVAFTYKLDLTKTNNDNTVLKNAKFRLYSDENCQNEVFVKQNKDGDYIVINRDSIVGDKAPAEAVEMVTDEHGNFIIYGLDGQVYYLKETDAPNGYRPLLDPIKLTINPTFTNERNSYIKGDGATDKTLINLSATAKFKEFYNGKPEEKNIDLVSNIDDGISYITVINQKGSQLAKTGDYAVWLSILGICLMSGAGFVLYKKLKVKN